MDITYKIQSKLTKILKKLKGLGIVQTFILEMTFCQVEESVRKSLVEIDTVLKKCLRKIISKPRKAEIRNIITELVRKKNLNDTLTVNEPVKSTLLLQENDEVDALSAKYLCSFCGETFSCEKHMFSHSKKHKKTEKYLCEKCGSLFYSKQHLLNHQNDPEEQLSAPLKSLTENIISEKAKNNDGLELKLNNEDNYERLKTARESSCPTQKNNKETKIAERKFICACGKIFRLLKTLRKHERIKHSVTTSQHKCNTCGKCFIERGKLNRHVLSHNDYGYHCSFCPKKFSRSDTLKRHISLFHLTSKKFDCSFCQKRFSLKYNRDIHEENVHKNISNTVQCDYCGSKFKNKTTLKSHLRTHFENRVTCTACGKSFSKKSYLEIHVKNKHFVRMPD